MSVTTSLSKLENDTTRFALRIHGSYLKRGVGYFVTSHVRSAKLFDSPETAKLAAEIWLSQDSPHAPAPDTVVEVVEVATEIIASRPLHTVMQVK